MGRMKAKHRIADRLFFLLLTILVFSSCANSKKDIIPSAEYAPFVNAYTGGVISQTSNIRIELTQDQLFRYAAGAEEDGKDTGK